MVPPGNQCVAVSYAFLPSHSFMLEHSETPPCPSAPTTGLSTMQCNAGMLRGHHKRGLHAPSVVTISGKERVEGKFISNFRESCFPGFHNAVSTAISSEVAALKQTDPAN